MLKWLRKRETGGNIRVLLKAKHQRCGAEEEKRVGNQEILVELHTRNIKDR